MQIEENNAMVIIDIPRFCVPAKDAEVFIRTANQFWADTVDEMLRNFESKRFEYDNKYVNGQFIPTVREIVSYSNCASTSIDVEQLDKYVKLDADEKYGKNDEIYNLWYPDEEQVEVENEVQEETKEEN